MQNSNFHSRLQEVRKRGGCVAQLYVERKEKSILMGLHLDGTHLVFKIIQLPSSKYHIVSTVPNWSAWYAPLIC